MSGKGERISVRRRISAAILLIVAVGVWLSWLSYITDALRHPDIPVTWGIFTAFLAGILAFLVPALLLFFPWRDRLSPFRFHIAMWLVITGLYWIFAPLYQYLSINTNRELVLWYMIPYAWEVPVMGYLYYAPVYHRFRRLREQFERYQNGKGANIELLRRRIVYLPVFAAVYFAIIALVAYGPIGSYQFRALGGAPWSEVIKNVLTGTALGFLSGSTVFFLLSRIVAPYLERLPPSMEHVPFPLHRKLTVFMITLVALAFLIYIPVAYKNAQILLGAHLLLETERAAGNCLGAGAEAGDVPCAGHEIGLRGYFFVMDQNGRIRSAHPRGFRDITEELLEPELEDMLLRQAPLGTVSRRFASRYIAAVPAPDGRIVVAVSYEDDFRELLLPFLRSGVLVGASFSIVFAALILLLTRGIADPIRKLTAAVRVIRAHQNPPVIRIGTGDEIALLSHEFSVMARQLRAYEGGLERKIAARTAELAEKNAVLERVIQDVQKFDEELKRLNAAKSEFISMASHQLRTPLTTIKWYTDAAAHLKRSGGDPQARRAIHEIAETNERMIQLVNGLLNVSRIEVGTLEIVPTMVKLASFLTGLVREVAPLAAARSVTLRKKILVGAAVRIDANLTREAVLNLLSNAIRYTPAGGSVTVELASKGRYFVISIADTGVGIPDKDKKLLFTKFFRGSNVADRDPHGTGLGLHIAKSVIEAMGGTVGFTSEENRGSTFWITIPRAGVKPRAGTRTLQSMRVTVS